jgi:hypothetical protein
MFRLPENDRERSRAPAETRPDTRVRRAPEVTRAGKTSTAHACEFFGERDMASERAKNARKTLRTAAGETGVRSQQLLSGRGLIDGLATLPVTLYLCECDKTGHRPILTRRRNG